jgi:hypothetical protein
MTDAEIEALRRGAETPVKAQKGDIAAVAEDLSASFESDPQFNWFLRDDARKPAARLAFFKMLLSEIALPDGVVSRPATGGAASIWLPSEALGPNPIWKELRALPAILRATGLARFPRIMAMREAMDKYHPMDRPHAFLESSNAANVPLYRRYGFEVIREYNPGPGAPPIWAMWREGR